MLSLWYENFPPGMWFRVSLGGGGWDSVGGGGAAVRGGGVRDTIQHVMIKVMPLNNTYPQK